MEATELRPLTLGELLDRTFTLYRRNFWLFAGIMAIPSAFSVPFSVAVFSSQGTAGLGASPSPAGAAGITVFVLSFLFLFWIVYAMGVGATTYAVSESYLGQKTTVRGSYSKVRGKFWRILGAVMVAWFRVVGIMVLLFIGAAIVVGIAAFAATAAARGGSQPVIRGIIMAVFVLAYVIGLGLGAVWALRYAVCIPALLLEDLGVLASLRRSVQLTRGRRWQMFVAFFLCTIVAYAGVIVFQGPFFVSIMLAARTGQLPRWLSFASAMSGAIGGAITGPILMIVLVLCYYDTRIRKEAFDLQFMMSALDHPMPAPDTPSTA